MPFSTYLYPLTLYLYRIEDISVHSCSVYLLLNYQFYLSLPSGRAQMTLQTRSSEKVYIKTICDKEFEERTVNKCREHIMFTVEEKTKDSLPGAGDGDLNNNNTLCPAV